MGEDYGYQDPEVEIKESGDVDFVEFADSIAEKTIVLHFMTLHQKVL